MGRPKQGLWVGGERLLDRVVAAVAGASPVPVVLVGAGTAVAGTGAALPRLDDAPGVAGPLAGQLAALRSEPAAWLMAACDLPLLSAAAVGWLVGERRPGRWAVVPRVAGVPQPLLAIYEPEALPLLERIAREGSPSPSRIAGHSRVWMPEPPEAVAAAWVGVNTPAELARVVARLAPGG
jgi:molybdopterin-guanine dinucleotide biosynthesis protein A